MKVLFYREQDVQEKLCFSLIHCAPFLCMLCAWEDNSCSQQDIYVYTLSSCLAISSPVLARERWNNVENVGKHHFILVPNNSTFRERYFSVYLYYFVNIFVCFPSVLSSFVISVLLLEAATLMTAAELAGLVIATGLDHIDQSMYICVY